VKLKYFFLRLLAPISQVAQKINKEKKTSSKQAGETYFLIKVLHKKKNRVEFTDGFCRRSAKSFIKVQFLLDPFNTLTGWH
jgi:hypothetical protein